MKIKSLLKVLMYVMMWTSIRAYAYEVNGAEYTFRVEGDGACVTGISLNNDCIGPWAIFPWMKVEQGISSSTTYPVRYIGDGTGPVFAWYNKFDGVVVPEGVVEIRARALRGINGNNNGASVSLPTTLKTVGIDAFEGGIDYLGIDDLAAWCDIDFANAAANPLTFAKTLRLVNKKLIINGYYSYDVIKNLSIPNGVEEVKAYAFNNCTSLESIVEFPITCKKIGPFAFSGTRISALTLPNHITSIGTNTFQGCTRLQTVSLDNGLKSVPANLFRDCSGIKSFTLGQSITAIEAGAFAGTGVTNLANCIRDGITSIGDDAFSHCSSLTRFALPSSVKRIGAGAFANCSSLPNVELPNGVTDIGDSAFCGCSSMTYLVVPASVTNIGNWITSNCGRLMVVVGPRRWQWYFNTCNPTANYIYNDALVTFDANGGEVDTESKLVNLYSAVGDLPVPTKSGCAFLGWFTTMEGGEQVTAATVANGDMTIYEHWTANTYAVTLDMQNGSGGTASVTVTYGNAMPNIILPRRMGYTFDGYFDGQNGTGTKYYNADGTSARTWNKANAASLYAKWTVNTYAIRFDANGGTGTMGDLAMTYDVSKNLAANGFAKTGYTFAGWAVSATGHAIYANGANVINLASAQGAVVTLYAVWQTSLSEAVDNAATGFASASDVQWIGVADPTAIGGESVQSGMVPYGQTVVLDAMVTNRGTLSFRYKVSGGTGDNLFAYRVDSDWKSLMFGRANGTDGNWVQETYSITNDGAHLVRWIYYPYEAAGVDVTNDCAWIDHVVWSPLFTFDGNGGTPATANTNYVAGSTYGRLPDASRTGYSMAGWFTASEGGKQVMSTGTVPNVGTTYYAHWQANTYAVTLDMQNGSGGTASVTATYGSAMPNIILPRRTGYTFDGYFDGQNGTGTKYCNADGTSARTWNKANAASLYAKWTVNTYAIRFDANGGTGTMGDLAMTYDASKNLAANGFTKTGYTFAGWAVSATGHAIYANGANVINLASAQGAVVTLYAVWQTSLSEAVDNAAIGFSSASDVPWKGVADPTAIGGESVQSGMVPYGQTAVLDTTVTNRGILSFRYKVSGGTGDSLFVYRVDSDRKSLMAGQTDGTGGEWIQETYCVTNDGAHLVRWIYYPYEASGVDITNDCAWIDQVTWSPLFTFDGNGGVPATSNINYVAGNTYGTMPNVSRVGYLMQGWFTSPDGGTQVISTHTVTNVGRTYYAHWTANTYVVTLDMQNGSGGTASVTATYGNAMPNIILPRRTGYTFDGYFDGQNGTGTKYYNADGTSARTWNLTSATTLYAKWTPIMYTIRFNANGGTGAMADLVMTYDVSKNLAVNGFLKAGYTFAGWSVSETSHSIYADGESVKNLTSVQGAVVTLYAVWQTSLSEAVDNAAIGFSTGSNVENDNAACWKGIADPTAIGGDSARSGMVPYGQTTFFDTTVTNRGILSFRYKVSGGTGDSLFVYRVDSDRKSLMAGQTDGTGGEWIQETYCVTNDGTHLVRWIYYPYEASGVDLSNDCAWIDQVTWSPLFTFDGNGGTPATTNINYVAGNTYGTMPNVSRVGYLMQGWFTSRDGGTQVISTHMVTNVGRTYYAHWTPKTYAVRFAANGGTGSMADLPMAYDESKPLTANGFTKAGCTFAGWAASASGHAIYAEGANVKNLTSAQGAVVTLYAVWQTSLSDALDNATISFSTGSSVENDYAARWMGVADQTAIGGDSARSGMVPYGQSSFIDTMVTNRGILSFRYKVSGGKGADLFAYRVDSDRKSLTAGRTNGTDGEWVQETHCVTSDGAHLVRWVYYPYEYTGVDVTNDCAWIDHVTWSPLFTFDGNGGVPATSNINYVAGSAYGILPTVSRAGYSMAGWFTSPDGGAQVFSTDIVPNVGTTLYAHWEENAYVVTVDADSGKTVTVPRSWITGHPALLEAVGGDAEAALRATAANGRMSVVECYVLGLDPESTTNDFKITSFPMKADGTPDLENIVFEPSEARWNVQGARPVVKGAANLGGEWQAVTEENKASFRFFKVEVALP